MQHTPGPWFVIPDPVWQGKHPCHDARYITTSDKVEVDDDECEDRGWWFEDSTNSIICTMPDSETQKADARLISAAPELLAACQFALGRLGYDGDDELCVVLRAALAKAQ